MEPNEITELVEELELRLERLGSLYSSFFQGIEKLPPNVVQKDVERRIWTLRREKIRNTGTRFKFNQITQRYNTMQSYWMRIMREIENGTYKRHVAKAKKRFGEDVFNPVKDARRQKAEELAAQERGDADVEIEVSMVNTGELMAYDEDVEIDAQSIRISQLDLGADHDVASLPPPAEERMAKPRSIPPPAATPKIPARAMSDPTMRAQAPQFLRPSNPRQPATQAKAPPPQRAVFGAEDDLDSLLDNALGGGDAAPAGRSAIAPPEPPATRPASSISQARAPAAPPPARPTSSARNPAVAADRHPFARPAPSTSQDRVPAQRPAQMQTQDGFPGPPPAPTQSRDRIPAQRAAAIPSNPSNPSIPSSPRIVAAQSKAPPATPAEGDDFRGIYARYVEAKRSNGESTASVTYDGLAKNLRETAEKLRAKAGGKQIDFEVATKDGKTILKPVVK